MKKLVALSLLIITPALAASQHIATDSNTLTFTNKTLTKPKIICAAPPSAPASGWLIYCDSSDSNKLKAIFTTGTIVTLGTP